MNNRIIMITSAILAAACLGSAGVIEIKKRQQREKDQAYAVQAMKTDAVQLAVLCGELKRWPMPGEVGAVDREMMTYNSTRIERWLKLAGKEHPLCGAAVELKSKIEFAAKPKSQPFHFQSVKEAAEDVFELASNFQP